MQETWVAQIDLEGVVLLFLVAVFTCLLETWEFQVLVCVDFFFFLPTSWSMQELSFQPGMNPVSLGVEA